MADTFGLEMLAAAASKKRKIPVKDRFSSIPLEKKFRPFQDMHYWEIPPPKQLLNITQMYADMTYSRDTNGYEALFFDQSHLVDNWTLDISISDCPVYFRLTDKGVPIGDRRGIAQGRKIKEWL